MLVSGAQLLKHADENNYAVGAFNTNNMEIVQAIIEAAEEERSPVILQASQGALKYAGIDYIMAMVKVAAEKASVPVVMNLDHGTDFNQVMMCIRYGFTNVMFDGSKYPLEKNIEITKKVIDVAHAVGVSVEGELGKIGGVEDNVVVAEKDATYTDPEEAVTFVKETDVDSLAIAIGTAHGAYKGQPKLDFDRLKTIKGLVNIPIVLHGASGIDDDSIRKAIELGVCKINIDTEIRQAFTKGVKQVLKDKPEEIDPRKILGPAREEMKNIVKTKMRLFGCSGKA
ncbi:MAG: class II fructose-1,6-bisphosphate aldolase [Clostridia bacterium]|nr:class II fructose-1,6-bisphosphate aldolase [Clostridia bacterium]